MKGENNFEKPERPDYVGPDPEPKEDATELMLVAYLDGEMSPAERRDFESRLESEPTLRRRLEQLRQAWDLLDELESCPPSKRFAETTLEMVAIDAEVHLKEEREKQRRQLRRRRNRIGLGLFVALLAGFVFIWFLYPSPDALLIKNLPLIVKLDQYEAAESVAFLEALAQAKLFTPLPASVSKVPKLTPEAADGTSLDQAPPIPESAKLRRQWVENLEPIQKAQLLQYWERFAQLSPERRQKLVDLQQELAKAEQSTLLTIVMRQYSEWLRRQPSFTRNGLLDLSPSDRISKLRSLRRGELDREGLKRWLQANHQKLKARFEEMARVMEARLGPPENPPLGLGPDGPDLAPEGPLQGPGPPGELGPRSPLVAPELFLKILPSEDLADLKGYLSRETAKEWGNMPLNAQRNWVRQMIHRMMFESGMERRISAKANNISDEELADFFEKHLTEEQKTKLLSTSGELLHEKLIELYMKDPSRSERLERMSGDHRGRGRGLGRAYGRRDREDDLQGKDPSEN